jgi:peptide/nickel transport system substrate-binding protein
MDLNNTRGRLTRREAFVRLGTFGLTVAVGSLLAACQTTAPSVPTSAPVGPSNPPTSAPAATPTSGGTALAPTAAAAAKPTTQTAPAANGASGGEASMAIFGAPGSSLLANFTTTNFAITIAQCCFESLLTYDDKLQFQPFLAEKWDVSPDGRTYTFSLRKGVTWSDGQPLVASDVLATVLAMTDPKTTTNWISYVEEIVGATDRKAGKSNDLPGIQVLDDSTLKVTTSQPSATFLDLFGVEFSVLPKHILDSIPMDQLNKSQFTNQPSVSTGPFTLVKYTADQETEFARNTNYWGKKPSLDRFFVKIMTPETAVVALEKGDLQVIPGEISGELPPQDADRLKQNPDITVTSYANNNTETLYPNLKTTFGDVRARQALLYGIDRESIVQQVLLGYGKVAYSVYPEFSPYYRADLNKYAYDPEKSKQLLQQANWDSGQQLDFLVPTGDSTRTTVSTIVQQYLQALGINAQIEQTDFATSVARLTQQHKFDLSLTQNRGFNNLDVSRRFASRMYDAGVNSGGYANTDLDNLMNDARSKVRLEDQKPLTDQIQQIINTDVPTVMMYYRDSIGAVNTKQLAGAKPRYRGVHRTLSDWSRK